MGSMFGGSPAPAAAPIVTTPAIVYQSDDPYAANYKPPTGAQKSTAQKAAAATPPAGVETDEQRLARLRRNSLILGAGLETWGGGGGDGASSGAADAGGASAGDADGGTGGGTGGTY